MTENVVYNVNMNDMLTPKLKQAEASAGMLETRLHQAGAAASKMGGAVMGMVKMLGFSFAAFKGFELIGEGIEKVKELRAAQAQVDAGLKSTSHAAGVSSADLKGWAADLSATTKFSKAEITSMQSLLVTFPSIVKSTFPAAENIIADMATRMGGDLKSATIQVGKALQDPIHGVSALRRVGVNFNEAQTDVIKNLVETGKMAEAQGLILKELNVEFGGSAKAAFDADPLIKYNKTMGSMKMAMGEAGMAIMETLSPAMMGLASGIKGVATWIKDVIGWFKEHEAVGKALVVGLGLVAAYYTTISVATSIWTAAQWLLNAAMTANPIGVIVVGIAALIAAVVYCWETFVGFRAVVMGVWGSLKAFGGLIVDYFTGVKDIIMGVLTFDPDQIGKGLDKVASVFTSAGSKIASGFSEGYNAEMKADADAKAKKKNEKSALGAGEVITTDGAAAAGTEAKGKKSKGTSAKGASGSKSVTITINIQKLIENFKVETTNIQGAGATQIREAVAQVLLGAVNDSQIVAGI